VLAAKALYRKWSGDYNDISVGNLDHAMLEVIAKYKVPYIMIHAWHTTNDAEYDPL
jgi:dihydropteroate synthase